MKLRIFSKFNYIITLYSLIFSQILINVNSAHSYHNQPQNN